MAHMLKRQSRLHLRAEYARGHKATVLSQIDSARQESASLLSEEDRLRREIEEMKARLADFKRVTALEIQSNKASQREKRLQGGNIMVVEELQAQQETH